ncbi:unnamed protein product [Caenorhabditis brenneri]
MKLLLLCFALFGASSAQFSPEGTSMILNGHNDFRSTIAMGWFTANGVQQPSATDMNKLIWADVLASEAQDYSSSCPSDYSGVDNRGEAMYYAWSTDNLDNLDGFGLDALNDWEQEFNNFGLSSLLYDQAASQSGIRDGVQMAFSTTTSVGCGVTNCGPDQDRFDQANKIVVVCRYGIQEDQIGLNIYEAGDTCSNCNNFLMCDNGSGLCA